MKLHKLLQTQLSRHLPEKLVNSPEYSKALTDFLEAISKTYCDFDSDQLSNREMRAQNTELEAIYKIALDIRTKEPTISVYTRIARQISEVTGFPIVCIKHLAWERKVYEIEALFGADNLMLDQGASRLKEIAASDLELIAGKDVYFDNEFKSHAPAKGFLATLQAGSLISVPLQIGGTVLGRITVAHPEAGRATPRLSTWLQSVAFQLANEQERRNLSELSEHQRASMFAASKMSELGKMAGGVAHEINTPLATILLFAESLRRDAEELKLEKFVKNSSQIEATVKRIAAIVKGLRAFSRDGSRDAFVEVDLQQVIEGTLALCGERFRHKEIDLRAEIPSGIQLRCRETQISQMLLNLLNNAYDAILGLNERWIVVAVQEKESTLEISVTDSGGGIPPEIQDRLGLPFFTTKPIGAGTGLGLSISTGIARDHGGNLEVDRTCKNTRFVVSLPKTTHVVPKAG